MLDDTLRALRETDAEPTKIASFEAEYVQLVWPGPAADRARLLAVARAAREALRGGGPSTTAGLERLEAWLVEHDLPSPSP